MEGQRVRVSHAADQDQLGGERADAPQLPEVGQGILAREAAQAVAVEPAFERGLREPAELRRLALVQAGNPVGQPRERRRRRERRHALAVNLDPLAQIERQALLERRRLRHPCTLTGDRPDGRLVGRPEQHRPQAAEAAAALADHRIALGHRGETGAVHVEGEDALHVAARELLELGAGVRGHDHVAVNGAVALLERDADGAPVAVERERERKPSLAAARGGAGKALGEVRRCVERERATRLHDESHRGDVASETARVPSTLRRARP